ncbi:MAG: hypothetical protein H6838_11540 [Planctomycetes bacterium]|nr:hypothetical protein [Planctomycetota bacterium]
MRPDCERGTRAAWRAVCGSYPVPYATLLLAAACAAGPSPLASSGDARLDALRQWAVQAPREDFVRVWNRWWSEFYFDYPRDEVLWCGVDRLARWALEHPQRAGFELLTALHAAAAQDPRRDSYLLARRDPLRELRASKNPRRVAPSPRTDG